MIVYQKMNRMVFLRWLDPFLPFCVLIGMKFGISYYEIFLLQSIYALAILFFEVPAGIISDIYGRKVALLLGSLLFSLAFLVFLVSPSFISWAIAEVIGGAAFACINGSDTALLYEYSQKKNVKSYQEKESNMQCYARAAECSSAALGFVALTVNDRLPIVIALVGKILMTVVVVTLPRERRTQARRDLMYWQEVKKLIKKMIQSKNKQPERFRFLGKLLVYSSMQSVLLLNMFWMLQVVLDVEKVPYWAIALVWMLYQFFSSVSSYYMRLGMGRSVKAMIISLPVLSILLLLVIAQADAFFTIPSMICFSFLWGIKIPMVNCIINLNSAKSMRATLHSIDSVATRLIHSILGPITGYIAQSTDNKLVFYWLILVITPGLVASMMLSTGGKSLKLNSNL